MEHRKLVEEQILEEMDLGNYVRTSDRPSIISALGAIPKSNGKVRLIHDGSLPSDKGMNSFMTNCDCSYMDLRNATKLIKEGSYIAKLDLKSAYRSVRIHPSNYQYTGLAWRFSGDTDLTYFFDSKLPFGASKSPKIFQTLTSAVCRIMKNKYGFDVIAYLDDFLIVSDDLKTCGQALTLLVNLLRRLGFSINWNKVEGPSKRLTFLGVEVDTEQCVLRLPEDKVCDLTEMLVSYRERKRASKKQLESLVGKMSWAAMVVQGGRTFLRRILNLKNTLRDSKDKAHLDNDFKADIWWWSEYFKSFNGRQKFIDPRPITTLQTDACMKGAGGYYNGDFFYVNWTFDMPIMESEHINVKEAIVIVLAAHRWASVWQNRKIVVRTDNITAKSIINKRTARSPFMMKYLRYLVWLEATYNFSLEAQYLPGSKNVLADCISRLCTNDGESLQTVLKASVNRLLMNGWAQTTSKTYASQLKCFLDFCTLVHIQPVPVLEEHLLQYIVYLVDVKCFKYASVRQYLCIVSNAHLWHGYSDPIKDSWQVNQVLRGARRELGDSQTGALPVTPNMLLSVRERLKLDTLLGASIMMGCLMGFYGMLRPGNFLCKTVFCADKDIRLCDVSVIEGGLNVTLRWTKTLQFREKRLQVILPAIESHPLDPVSCMNNLLELHGVGDAEGPLLCNNQREALKESLFIETVNHILHETDTSITVTGHSFRRGGASWAFKQNMPGEMIQDIGFWKSPAYLRYINIQSVTKLEALKKFGSSLPYC